MAGGRKARTASRVLKISVLKTRDKKKENKKKERKERKKEKKRRKKKKGSFNICRNRSISAEHIAILFAFKHKHRKACALKQESYEY